jgi:hypothetical protein
MGLLSSSSSLFEFKGFVAGRMMCCGIKEIPFLALSLLLLFLSLSKKKNGGETARLMMSRGGGNLIESKDERMDR